MSQDWQQQYANPPLTPLEPPKAPNRFRGVLVAFLAAVGAVGGFVLVKVVLSSTFSADVPTVATSTWTPPVKQYAVSPPEKLGGRALNTAPEMVKEGTDVEASVVNLTSPMSKYYGTPGKDLVYVFAAKAETKKVSMQGTLRTFVRQLISTPGNKELKAAEVTDPGNLGGTGECGVLELAGAPAAYCGWADAETLGILIWYGVDLPQAQKEFVILREQIEKVS